MFYIMESAICINNIYNSNLVDDKCNYKINPLIIQLCKIYILYSCIVIIPHTLDYINNININKLDIIIYDPLLNKQIQMVNDKNDCYTTDIKSDTNKIYFLDKTNKPNICYITDKDNLISMLKDNDVNTLLYYQNIINKKSKAILKDLNTNFNVNKMKYLSLRGMVKSISEINNITQACKIIDKAFIKLWSNLVVIHTSKQIYNVLLDTIKLNTNLLAYPPIITQSSTIHPKFKNYVINKEILVLIDIGCRYNGYCSDITRTFSLKGYFNKLQSDLYNIVLKCFKYACRLLKPNVLYYNIDTQIFKILKEELILYGLITSDDKADYLTRKLMPHTIGHTVGLNVHDVTRDNFILQKNDIVTIEPGIYFPLSLQNNEGINKNMYSEIRKSIRCIRIEDTLKIEENGCKSLTNLPIEIDEINTLINLN